MNLGTPCSKPDPAPQVAGAGAWDLAGWLLENCRGRQARAMPGDAIQIQKKTATKDSAQTWIWGALAKPQDVHCFFGILGLFPGQVETDGVTRLDGRVKPQ